jgi:hypothetical protein
MLARAAVVTVALLAGIAIAWYGDTPPATATPTHTPTAAPTLSPPNAAPALPVAVTRLIEAVHARDGDAINAMLQFVHAPCTERTGIGGPPKCWVGGTSYKEGNVPPDGTIVEVFLHSGCEFGWLQGTQLLNFLLFTIANSGDLHSVIRVNSPLFQEDDAPYPGATHAALFTHSLSPDASIVYFVEESGLTFIDYPCIMPPGALLAEHPRYRDAEVIYRGPAFRP